MRTAIILALVLLVLCSSWAAENDDGKMTLKLDGVDIVDALSRVSEKAQVTILGDSTVKGKVSCSLQDVTLEQALNTICTVNKLEWVKVHTTVSPDEKLSASDLFAALDALKALGGRTLVCQDVKGGSETVYVPDAKAGSVDMPALATKLGLKAVYLLRAIPEEEGDKAKEGEKVAKDEGVPFPPPPSDSRMAAGYVWDYFMAMPESQRGQVMRELGQMYMNAMPAEQRMEMHRRFEERRHRRDGQD